MSTPATAWMLLGVPGSVRLNVVMAVDTTAPEVVDAIEAAAVANGVRLERVKGDLRWGSMEKTMGSLLSPDDE